MRDGDKLLIALLTHGCVLLPQAIGSNNEDTDSMSNTVPDYVAVPYGFSIKVVLFANVIGSLAHTALPRTRKGCLTAYRRTWD